MSVTVSDAAAVWDQLFRVQIKTWHLSLPLCVSFGVFFYDLGGWVGVN